MYAAVWLKATPCRTRYQSYWGNEAGSIHFLNVAVPWRTRMWPRALERKHGRCGICPDRRKRRKGEQYAAPAMSRTALRREPSSLHDNALKVASLDTVGYEPGRRETGDVEDIEAKLDDMAVRSAGRKPRRSDPSSRMALLVDEHLVTLMIEAQARRNAGETAIRCGQDPGVPWTVMLDNAGMTHTLVASSKRDPDLRRPLFL